MKRKITKNKHQYKVSLPIELIRKLNWDNSTEIKFHQVDTPFGKGLLIVEDDNKMIRLRMK